MIEMLKELKDFDLTKLKKLTNFDFGMLKDVDFDMLKELKKFDSKILKECMKAIERYEVVNSLFGSKPFTLDDVVNTEIMLEKR